MEPSIIRLGGVPEHFNLPIHLAMERGEFASRGVEVSWTTFRGGTGQMTKALREGEVDICILLTEGIITDIIRGNPSKIISEYVITPLSWGIHTAADNPLQHYEEIFSRKYAISRFGSGSHLMAIVDAMGRGESIDKDQFQVIGNLEGALESLDQHHTDVFYWEKYTTKPYVDAGKLRRLGVYRTPWPCFVIAARDEILEKQPENVIRILRTIHDCCDSFMRRDENIWLVAKRYGLETKDAEGWYHSTEWAIHGWVSNKMLKNVIYHLKAAEIIGGQEPPGIDLEKKISETPKNNLDLFACSFFPALRQKKPLLARQARFSFLDLERNIYAKRGSYFSSLTKVDLHPSATVFFVS